jgi:hypothetical protein
MHDRHAMFLVLVLCDPELMKRPEGSEDRAPEPGCVLFLKGNEGRVDLDFLLYVFSALQFESPRHGSSSCVPELPLLRSTPTPSNSPSRRITTRTLSQT